MAITHSTFTRGHLSEAVNRELSEVGPGFMESSDSPVMWTPIVVPAAVMATQASALCAAC